MPLGSSMALDHAGPLQKVLSRLRGQEHKLRQCSPTQWSARCPAHDDRQASLSIGVGNDGRALLHCHAGCSTKDVATALGVEMGDLMADNSNTYSKRREPTKRKAYPSRESALDALRATMTKEGQQLAGTWDYHNAAGEVVATVARFDGPLPPDASPGTKPPKTFRPVSHHPEGWQREDPPGKWPPYRLPTLAGAKRIYVVEGEKAADAAASIGLTATTSAHGSQSPAKTDWSAAAAVGDIVILPDNDDAGRKYAQSVGDILRGLNPHARVRIVELPDLPEKGDIVEFTTARQGQTPDAIRAAIEGLVDATTSCQPPLADDDTPTRPLIIVDTDEHRVLNETTGALAKEPGLYRRGGVLVHVVQSDPRTAAPNGAGRPTIRQLPQANLRVRLTHAAGFGVEKHAKDGSCLVMIHPPDWLVRAVDGAGDWPGIPYLAAISQTPVLRPDGTVLQTSGYDPVTGVLYLPERDFPPINPAPSTDDVQAAVETLCEAVCDFRFERPEHKAAWFAAVLTPVGRYAFEGPSPIFVIDSNVRGAGKGLLVQTIALTAQGRQFATDGYVHDSAEMRKKITSFAIAGHPTVLLDNIEGPFGNDAIDRAVTSTRWADRILGRNEQVDLPLYVIWYVTGNNIVIAADTMRRVIHVRLEVPDENPELRTGFRHPYLLRWLHDNQPRLLAAALTILVAYIKAGRPQKPLPPFGSFEGWSDLIRQALVWIGLPDPVLTRVRMALEADKTVEVLREFNGAWRSYARTKGLKHLVAAELLAELYPSRRDDYPKDPDSRALRAAIEGLLDTPGGRTPTARELGGRLRTVRGRVVGGCRWMRCEDKGRNGAFWVLEKVEPEAMPGRDSGSPPAGDSPTSTGTVATANAAAAGG